MKFKRHLLNSLETSMGTKKKKNEKGIWRRFWIKLIVVTMYYLTKMNNV